MESHLGESQRWMAKARSSVTAAEKLLEEALFAESKLYCQRSQSFIFEGLKLEGQ